MTSGMGAGERTGEFRGQVRGGGSGGRSLRRGSALTLIAWVSALLTLLCVVLAFVAGVANGLLLLAMIFAATFTWSVGGFQAHFWSR